MEWIKSENGFTTATVKFDASVDAAMIGIIEKIKGDIIPLNKNVEWDYIRIEFWADSGRLIVFPASTKSKNRIELSGCQIVFDRMLKQYEELADSDISDSEFTCRLLAEEQEWIDKFMNAARKKSLDGVRIVFCDAEDEQSILETVI